MRTITQGWLLAMLTTTKEQPASFCGIKFNGQKFRVSMGSIAKWLLGTFTTGTPVVRLTSNHFYGIRRFLNYDGISHGFVFLFSDKSKIGELKN